MMTDVLRASKFSEWKEDFNWDTCLTGREKYGNFLVSILTSETNGHVINLNGAWGTGKTELLKRLYVSIAKKQHPVIYINAWESDFINDPLSVICAEFLNQLGYLLANSRPTKELVDIHEALNKLMGSISKVAYIFKLSSLGYKAVTGDATLNEEFDFSQTLLDLTTQQNSSSMSLENYNKSIISSMLGNQIDLVEGMKEIRKQITSISHILCDIYGCNSPIIVLVDELDRCRPDYAIKTLEVIKHFFDVDGCNFLIASDTESLQESIKCIYGQGFDSERYLRRFFNQKIALKKPSIYKYLLKKGIDFDGMCPNMTLTPYSNNNERKIKFLSEMLNNENFELRDIERFIQKLTACIGYISKFNIKNAKFINFCVLAYGIYEHEKHISTFKARTNKMSSHGIHCNGYLWNEMSVSNLITLHLKMVTLTNSSKRYNLEGGGSTSSYQTEMLTAEAQDLQTRDWERDDLIGCERLIQNYRNAPNSFLLWEDYQKLIGLTDAIE